MLDASEMVRVQCACGKRLLAPITAIGKSSKCPKCGRMVTVPSATEVDMGEAPEQLDFAMGRGVLYCTIAGLIAAGIWAAICAFAGGQIGLLICAIGAACGFGMMMGTKRRSGEVGFIAAGIAMFCMIAGKCLLAAMMASGAAEQGTAQEREEARAERDSAISALMVDSQLKEEPDIPAEEVQAKVHEKLAGMTDRQKQQYLDQQLARAKASGTPGAGIGRFGVRETVGFLALLLAFGMWDIIAVVGGAALAYGLATFNDLT